MTSALVAIAALVLTDSGFDFESHRTVSLVEFEKQVESEHPDFRSKLRDRAKGLEMDTMHNHPVEKIQFQATFTGKTRELVGFKGSAIQGWLDVNWPAKSRGGFRREIQVFTGGHTFWMPLQETLWPFLEREVPQGKAMTVYAAWLGAINGEFAYLVNEFKAFDQVPLKPAPTKAE